MEKQVSFVKFHSWLVEAMINNWSEWECKLQSNKILSIFENKNFGSKFNLCIDFWMGLILFCRFSEQNQQSHQLFNMCLSKEQMDWNSFFSRAVCCKIARIIKAEKWFASNKQDVILLQKRFVNSWDNHENDNPLKKLLLCDNNHLLLRQYYFIYSFICLPSRHTHSMGICVPHLNLKILCFWQ
jgi:hypothetical protein